MDNIGLIVAGVVVAILVILIILTYNNLVRKANAFKNAFAQIDVQLKRRYDLIPQLIDTVRGYMKHERETLDSVVRARSEAQSKLRAAESAPGSAAAMEGLAGAEQMLGSALGRINALAEQYPDLKASQNFLQLQEDMASTENRISFARQAYNDSVLSYNTYRQSFPQVVIAPLVGHGSDAKLLEFKDREQLQEAPKVSF